MTNIYAMQGAAERLTSDGFWNIIELTHFGNGMTLAFVGFTGAVRATLFTPIKGKI